MHVREVDRIDELVLEIRVGSRLHVADGVGQQCCLQPLVAVEQHDQRAVAGCVAYGEHVLQVTVRDQAQDHRVQRIDVRAERAGQHDTVYLLEAVLSHQQLGAGVQRGLGQLDRAHVVGVDDDLAAGAGLVRPGQYEIGLARARRSVGRI